MSYQLVLGVVRVAEQFMQLQDQLTTARGRGEDPELLERRFDTELSPLSRALDRSLDQLVAHEEESLSNLYEARRADRVELETWLYALLGTIVLAGVGIAWTFATLLGRSYRQKDDALVTARNAVAARDEVISIVAHDLRNPLGAITMRASLLREQVESAANQQHANVIVNVAMRMEYLIKTMLDVATLEAGRFAVLRGPCDVDEMMRDVMALFEPLAAAKQVSLESHVAEPRLVIHADRERIMQVFSNLLGNALKFTPRGGHVTITVERSGDDVRFAVFDTGPGIAPDDLTRVFERFWTDETPGRKSTGLGLFIAKGIVAAHGGTITASSELGHGARFDFTIPIETPPVVPVAKSVTRQNGHAS